MRVERADEDVEVGGVMDDSRFGAKTRIAVFDWLECPEVSDRCGAAPCGVRIGSVDEGRSFRTARSRSRYSNACNVDRWRLRCRSRRYRRDEKSALC